ncbi:predicted protein [Histoplasma capsulatum var. duboisii H88]|uniref:Predicted protein n=1 Tax=Ajellomyces capsulatus (strain H88) TaxID=544711 RepID=F0U6C7_AJEC8|nr:predicted protein [Histoplasma capsulatum var. duboisii H88]
MGTRVTDTLKSWGSPEHCGSQESFVGVPDTWITPQNSCVAKLSCSFSRCPMRSEPRPLVRRHVMLLQPFQLKMTHGCLPSYVLGDVSTGSPTRIRGPVSLRLISEVFRLVAGYRFYSRKNVGSHQPASSSRSGKGMKPIYNVIPGTCAVHRLRQ